MKKKAVFLDRDGVVNVDRGYVFKKEDFEFTPDLFPVLRKLNEKGYLLIVVTNQSGIGRGYYSESDFLGLTDWMLERLRKEGVEITGVYHCPHAPEETCSCRKPEPGMFLRAIEDHNINPSSSWMVGDKPSDMEAAMGAGVGNRVMIGPARSEHGTHTVSRIQMLCDLIP